tara:strand:- start:1061 stop:1183 length:123 start_codon:yes stop_codon:yes gene_type:complete
MPENHGTTERSFRPVVVQEFIGSLPRKDYMPHTDFLLRTG